MILFFVYILAASSIKILYYESSKFPETIHTKFLEFIENTTLSSFNIERASLDKEPIEIVKKKTDGDFKDIILEAKRLQINYIIGVSDIELEIIDDLLGNDLLYLYPYQTDILDCYRSIISFGSFNKILSAGININNHT